MAVPPSSEDLNELERARWVNRQRTVQSAFLQTFGPASSRTPLGKVILDELERFTTWRKTIRVTDANGQTDIYATARAEGRREVMQAIHDIIEWKEQTDGSISGGRS